MPTKTRLGTYGPTLPLVVFGTSSLLAQWDDSALSVLLPDIRATFALNLQFLVGLNAAMGILAVALALPVGALADRVRRVWLLRAGAITTNAGSIVQGLAPGVGPLVGGRIVAGVGTALIPPASFSYLADTYPAAVRARVFGLLYVAAGIGGIVGPIVAGFLASALGWRSSLVLLGVLATGVSLLTFLLREPRRGGSDDAEPRPPLGTGEALRTAFAIGTVRRLCFATPFIAAKGAGTTLLTIYFADVFVLGPEARGVLFAVYSGVGVVGLLLTTPFADRLLAERPASFLPLAGGLLGLQAIALVVLAASSNLALSIAASIPLMTVDLIFAPALLALLSQVVPPQVRGVGLQITAPFQLAGFLLSVLIVGSFGTGGVHRGIGLFALPTLIAAGIIGTGALAVTRDLRNAKASRSARSVEPGSDSLLIVRDLEAGFDGVPVLFGVDLDIKPGEIVALVGTNGAGKSTLLRAIAGLQPLGAGALVLSGEEITGAPAHERARRGMSLLAGGDAVFADLTVLEHLRLAAPATETSIQPGIDAFPALGTLLARRAGDLSGGEQQQVALAQAVLAKPVLLLIDELSLGLAPAVVEDLLAVIRRLRDEGTTVVLVEQSLNVALQIADRAVFLERGTIRFDGPVAHLLGQPELVRATIMSGGRSSRSLRPSAQSGRAAATAPRLVASGLGARFGGIVALSDVEFSAAAGEIVGIIGPNGAGKTTLFDVLSGFVPDATGAVRLGDEDITALAPHERARRGLMRSFQQARLYPTLSVRETVMTALDHRAVSNPLLAAIWAPPVRRSEAALARRAEGFLELLGISDRADDAVSSLSTGVRRIVDVACTLAAEPSVLLLDEPSSGLAQAEVETLGPLLTRIVRETGCSLIVIEHDIGLVSAVSDRLVAMDLGRVIASGPPDDVRSHPNVLASYLAASDAVLGRSGPATRKG